MFFIRYWLLGRKWSYGRKGMTEARIKQRKSKLAVWLREGLVKLGPTFIKVRGHAPVLPCHNYADTRPVYMYIERACSY